MKTCPKTEYSSDEKWLRRPLGRSGRDIVEGLLKFFRRVKLIDKDFFGLLPKSWATPRCDWNRVILANLGGLSKK